MADWDLNWGKQWLHGELPCDDANGNMRHGKEQRDLPLDIHGEHIGRASVGWLGS